MLTGHGYIPFPFVCVYFLCPRKQTCTNTHMRTTHKFSLRTQTTPLLYTHTKTHRPLLQTSSVCAYTHPHMLTHAHTKINSLPPYTCSHTHTCTQHLDIPGPGPSVFPLQSLAAEQFSTRNIAAVGDGGDGRAHKNLIHKLTKTLGDHITHNKLIMLRKLLKILLNRMGACFHHFLQMYTICLF